MKYRFRFVSFILVISLLLSMASLASAQSRTEVYGFYEGYRNFDYKTGGEGYPFILNAELNGGGGGIAYQYVPWFALFTQVSFLGTAMGDNLSARVINNLEGIRYSTPRYGPISFYGKGGVGFTNYSVVITDLGEGGQTKFSAGYAGGAQIWATDYLGLFVEMQHLIMGVPNVFDAEGRDRWDSGLTYKTGLAIRF
jgi:hypothetical protein